MLKKIFMLLISMLLLMSGCTNHSADNVEIDLAELDLVDLMEKEELDQPPSKAHFMIPLPDSYSNNDELLLNVGIVKFSELDKSQSDPLTIEPLEGLTELYKPGYIKPGFTLTTIPVRSRITLSLLFYDAVTDESASFEWERSMLVENATKDFLRGSAAAEYIEERNGVTYAVKEWASRETGEHASYEVGWAQHGQVFTAYCPASFTLEEVLAFCDAQPIEAWELLGDALSVSIQGMEDVSIFESSGVSKSPSRGASNEIIAVDDVLYKSMNMEKVGYRWLIDETTSRYQYVLSPDTYEFRANGVNNEPGLLIKHFEAGEISSTVDLTSSFEDTAVNGFSLIVAAEGILEFTTGTETYSIYFEGEEELEISPGEETYVTAMAQYYKSRFLYGQLQHHRQLKALI